MPSVSTSARGVKVVDLFSGCGGLSLGAREACASLGLDFDLVMGVDTDAAALAILGKNFLGVGTERADVAEMFNGAFGESATPTEQALARRIGSLDLLLGGPPCQGHSDFNNRTRRLDPKNELFFSMVRAAEILEPEHVVIENVPGAMNDHCRVVQRSLEALSTLGYSVGTGIVDATRIGVAQRRRRLLVLASKAVVPAVNGIEAEYGRPIRGVGWAIEDLRDAEPTTVFDYPAQSAPATRRRIDYLFNNAIFDLPNSERPACHRDRQHTYRSIYGRLSADAPSQTITRGFYSMCMGRYVHPTERRTLTAHEAARLQYFPDYFDFSAAPGRTQLAKVIGNAVPSRLGQVAVMELLR